MNWAVELCYPGLDPFVWQCEAADYEDALRVAKKEAHRCYPPGFDAVSAARGVALCMFAQGATLIEIQAAETRLKALRANEGTLRGPRARVGEGWRGRMNELTVTWVVELRYPGCESFLWQCQAVDHEDALQVAKKAASRLHPPGFDALSAKKGCFVCVFVPDVTALEVMAAYVKHPLSAGHRKRK